MKIDIS